MTKMEFTNSEEYRQQKRLIYFGTCRVSKKMSLGMFAHQKAMEYYNKKYRQKEIVPEVAE